MDSTVGGDALENQQPTSIPTEASDEVDMVDPLIGQRKACDIVLRGECALLVFADGKHVFCDSVGEKSVKVNKRNYRTTHLVGLAYGTLIEVDKSYLKILPPTESLVPPMDEFMNYAEFEEDEEEEDEEEEEEKESEELDVQLQDLSKETIDATESENKERSRKRLNRNLHDGNTSQALSQFDLLQMRKNSKSGKHIVQKLMLNSTTFATKTEFSKQKYVQKKQQKYQPRCRLVRCTASSIAEALFQKDPKKYANMRSDTLAQILSYSNITAGAHVLVWEDISGLVTGAICERMGGYGKLFSLYTGQQPASNEVVFKFNFSQAAQQCLQWVHVGDVFNPKDAATMDVEAADRDSVEWPCPLQSHTKDYLRTRLKNKRQQEIFLEKRSTRFTRKLTRPSPLESVQALRARQVDSLILAVRGYDLQQTLEQILPFLQPSCPFVVFCEYLEPLVQTFAWLQEEQAAIHLRLVTAWTRQYQVLPQRTHPNMNMTQNAGYLLTGIKLDHEYGKNDLSEEQLSKIRASLPTRRGKKRKQEGPSPVGNGCGE